MSAPRFFVPAPLDRSALGERLALPEAVAHHAVRVRRLSAGDALTLFDGRGGEYEATLTTVERRSATARLERFDPVEREAPWPVALVLSVIAADPMEIAIRKSVELGAARILPVVAARSQGGSLAGKADRRVAHWREIAVAACEQCGRNRIPEVNEPVPFAQWIDAGSEAQAVMLAMHAQRTLAACARESVPRALIVGPEGGWTDDEVAMGRSRGIALAHLGPRVLRAETAAIAALATIQAIAGDAR